MTWFKKHSQNGAVAYVVRAIIDRSSPSPSSALRGFPCTPSSGLVSCHLVRLLQCRFGHTFQTVSFVGRSSTSPVVANEIFSLLHVCLSVIFALTRLAMVDIYLPIEDRQILALSIPFVDIERLSLRPVKWLRFLLFTICGVRGELTTTPNGPPVDYDTSTLDNMDEAYYFAPEGM